LVAKRDYHDAKAKLYDLQLQLEEARDNLSDGRRLGGVSAHELSELEATVYDIEDMVRLAEATVDNASRAVGRLIAKQDRRSTVAGQLSDLLFRPGSGLVELILVDEGTDDGDRLDPGAFFDGWFGATREGGFPPFVRPLLFGDETAPRRESLFETGRKLFGDAAVHVFGPRVAEDRDDSSAKTPPQG
jgi:hypothetical protein